MINGRLTNREKARCDPEFQRACKVAGVFPSRPQYMKWKRGRGAAFRATHLAPLDNEDDLEIQVQASK